MVLARRHLKFIKLGNNVTGDGAQFSLLWATHFITSQSPVYVTNYYCFLWPVALSPLLNAFLLRPFYV